MARIVDSTLTRAAQTHPILHGGQDLIVYSSTKYNIILYYCYMYTHVHVHVYFMEVGGPDVVQMSKKSKEATLLLVVPYLQDAHMYTGTVHIHVHVHCTLYMYTYIVHVHTYTLYTN